MAEEISRKPRRKEARATAGGGPVGGAPVRETPLRGTAARETAGARRHPLVLLKNTVVFPKTRMTINIGRERSVLAVKAAHESNQRFVAASQRQADTETPTPEDAFDVAALVEIRQYDQQNDGAIQIVIEGLQRVRVHSWEAQEPFPLVSIREIPEPPVDPLQGEAITRHAQSLFERFTHLSRRFSAEDVAGVVDIHTPGHLADALASLALTEHMQQQDLLEVADPLARLEKICVILGNEIEILELENKIRQRVRQQVDKNQREYYLKEQMRAIQEELGNDQASEVKELRDKVQAKGLPEEVQARVTKEIDRLERMPSHSAELVVLRNYLDWILALPWQERTKDHLDMPHARRVLDEDHYGLEKVKERIVEFLAVRQLRLQQAQRAPEANTADNANGAAPGATNAHNAHAHKGPILCLIGPPGVGKTSLGRSVARALGRTFVRISLGGLHDEAEIRGHRRTYVGALPGRILQAMKTAGVRNPVFLLDEIDKVGADYRGDPSAALLEVLDPEQNSTFTDHYLEVPYDLSEVFFICTGNNRYQIARALSDRMDIVELPGYTEEEKIAIGRNYLLPKVLEEHGLDRAQVQLPQPVLRHIITHYTREAGVRSLERQLATVCRKAALRIVEKPEAHIRLTEKTVEHYLGVPRYSPDKAPERMQVGVATGLAWTSNGGTLLPVEVVTMPGKGGLIVTGQLGDVMQESARAALSYIRSRAAELRIPKDFPSELDIHIHLPEGAIPKDGPSAGITMALAMISALTRRPVRSDLAMTGEITLRGRVLAIGGLKEKALAAYRVGIRHLLIPADNEKDLADIPPKIRANMEFTPVETMDEVLQHALLERETSGEDAAVAEPTDGPAADPRVVPTLEEVARGEDDEEVPPPATPGEPHEQPSAGTSL